MIIQPAAQEEERTARIERQRTRLQVGLELGHLLSEAARLRCRGSGPLRDPRAGLGEVDAASPRRRLLRGDERDAEGARQIAARRRTVREREESPGVGVAVAE